MPRPPVSSTPSDPAPEALTDAEAREAIGRLRRRLAALEAAHPEAARAAAAAAGSPPLAAGSAPFPDDGRLGELLMRAPAVIGQFKGPEHTLVFANGAYAEAVGGRPVLGRPLLEALPELAAQQVAALMDQVYRTGEPWEGDEVPVQVDATGRGDLEERYYNLVYRPWCAPGGDVQGVLTFAFEVTPLVRARQKLEAALRVSRTGTYTLHPRLRRVEPDAPLCALFELEDGARSLSIGAFLRRIHPDDRATVESTMRRRFVTDEEQDLEYRIVCTDGSIRWMWDKARTARDAAGAPLHLVGACTDITDRKEAEQALHASETRLQAVLDALPVSVALADADGRLVRYNPAVRALWGEAPLVQGPSEYEAFEMRDARTGTPVPPDARPLMAALRTGAPVPPAEYAIRTFNGDHKTILNSGTPILDDAGSVTGAVSVSIDISGRKAAEEALRRSEERFRSLVEASTAIVWTVGASGVVEDPMPGWAAFTGQDFEAHSGWGWLEAIHPGDRAATEAAWRRAIEGPGPYEVRHRLRRHDGVYRQMLARAVPLVEDGIVREWVGTHTDLTELLRAEAELRRLNETLEERVSERTQALTNANAQLREAQDALSLAYRRLRGIIDGTEDYIAAFDAEMRLTVFNQAYADEVERTFGVRPRSDMALEDYVEEAGAHLQPLLDETRRRWGRVLAGEAFAVEQAIPHPDGTPRYVESRYSPIRDGEGAVVGGVALVRDITERFEAQRAVERNEAHFREALSGAQVVLARMDTERRYEWIHNPALPIGYENVIGRRDEDLFPPDEVQPLIDLKKEVIRTGRPMRRELTFSIGEERRVYDLTAAPLRGPDGTVVGLTTASLDVTTYRQTREALAHSETRYRTLITAMNEGVVLYGEDGAIRAANPAAEAILGVEAATLHGRSPADPAWQPVREDGRPYTPDDHPAAVALRTGAPVLNETMGIRRPDGAFVWVSLNAQPLRRGTAEAAEGGEGAVEGVVVTFRDITEAKHAEERLARTNRELEQRNRELQDFAYVASHDLQEPLRKIRAFADLLGKDFGEVLADEGRLYLDRVQHAATRMSQLITDLLAFSRVQTQGEAFRAVDLETVLADVLADLEVRLAETGGTVETSGLPSIEADPLQMRQLLQNLVGNALKFHREDEPPAVHVAATVEARPRPGGGSHEVCVLEVSDNGIGFEQKYLDRIFVPFQRLHGRTAYEGTGMGLAICRRIVERHGGDITARSSPDAGATFVVTLPLYQ